MTEKFTKGPWYADKYGKIWRNVPSDLYEYGGKIAGDMPLAFVSKGWYEKDETPYPQQANADLIAAAPDMYEALEEVIRIYNFKEMVRVGRTLNSPKDDPDKGKIFFTYNDLSKARDALRKARGEEE